MSFLKDHNGIPCSLDGDEYMYNETHKYKLTIGLLQTSYFKMQLERFLFSTVLLFHISTIQFRACRCDDVTLARL